MASIPVTPAIFQTQHAKKNQQVATSSQGNIDLQWPHRVLWRDSFKGVDHTLTSDKPILLNIIMIITVSVDELLMVIILVRVTKHCYCPDLLIFLKPEVENCSHG